MRIVRRRRVVRVVVRVMPAAALAISSPALTVHAEATHAVVGRALDVHVVVVAVVEGVWEGGSVRVR